MILTTNGCVLHTTSFSETSVIARIYTLHSGMQSFMINGVRKPKSKFNANLLQPLSLVELIAHVKENRDVQRMSELSAAPAFKNIPYDIAKSSLAFFIAEILLKSIREEEANEALFNFIKSNLLFLDETTENCKQFHHYFLLQLTKHLGFFPHGECEGTEIIFDLREGLFQSSYPPYAEFITGRNAELFSLLSQASIQQYHTIETTSAERKELLQVILMYYELHVLQGSKIRSHEVLSEVL